MDKSFHCHGYSKALVASCPRLGQTHLDIGDGDRILA